jgi:hypothetical protein
MYVEIFSANTTIALQDKVNQWVVLEVGRVRVLNISPVSYQEVDNNLFRYFITVVYEPR